MLSYGAGITHFAESEDRCLYEVVGVGRTLRLRKDVGDTYAFKHGAHCTTSHHSRTFRGRKDEHFGTAETCSLLVRYGSLNDGHLHEVLLGGFNALGDCSGNFAGFAESVTDNAFTVTHHYDSCEGESASALSDFRNTIDSNESIFQFFIVCVYSDCHNL